MNPDKYFRTYAEINLKNIKDNVSALQSKLSDGSKIIGVIKTNAYGHGAVEVGKAIADQCAGFAVATYAEAVELRENNIDLPIYILGYEHESCYEGVVANDFIPCIFAYEMAEALSRSAKAVGKDAKINIAVDTGMSRIGFDTTDKSIDTIKKISELDNIKIESIFTHFAKADYVDKTVAEKQLDTFKEFIDRLASVGVEIPLHQCANSAAIMELPQASMDLARAGISMYGLNPSDEVTGDYLKPVLSWKSHVVFVKDIAEGTGVSYGHTFMADKPMTIATIPVGYGDGYPRLLSNKGDVLIAGKRCKILGRVCMDQFMVDVTGMDVKVGDEVTLIGKDGDEEITADEIANLTGTINYEVVCDIGKRVPRKYIEE